ncbi:unnamed protein product [Lactuca virosa]|uniref:Uncharacterized protein n=1 Tax=Lactuca virosa TaxID=75947 RepID=A0AAU9NSM5_9ASTR|nr:unnamed protein product [Lactuca virosa]
MHQLVQEMGRFEVRQESPDKPWKRSRLWCHKESFKVLKHKKGKGNLLGLALDMRMLEKEKLVVILIHNDLKRDKSWMGRALKTKDGPHYEDQKEECWFRAFSQKNPGIIGRAREGKGESSRSHPS